MADLAGPSSYLEKLRFAQRIVRSAKFRNDPKQAIHELSEAVYELTTALIYREEQREGFLSADKSTENPGP